MLVKKYLTSKKIKYLLEYVLAYANMFSIYTKAYSQYEGRLIFLHNFSIILGKGVDFINEFATEKDLLIKHCCQCNSKL